MPKSRLAFSTLLCVLLFPIPQAEKGAHRVTEADVKAIVQAIEDEIYDYEYQGYDFGYVGQSIGRDEVRIPVYIQPHSDEPQGMGRVIYKLMPCGEVYRLFSIEDDGLAIVYGNPEFGFPAHRPNYLAVYMDDDRLWRFKHEWLKSSYMIQLHPSAERLRQAAERQKKRTGHSVREDPGWRFYPPGRDPRCP